MAQAVASIVDVARASVQAFNEKNWDKVREVTAQDAVYDEVGTNRKVRGLTDLMTVWRGWANAIPDATATIEHVFVDGNVALLEMTWRGTNLGPLETPKGEVPPTGKRFEVRAIQVVEIAGDKVKNVRHYFDMASLLHQLGLSA